MSITNSNSSELIAELNRLKTNVQNEDFNGGVLGEDLQTLIVDFHKKIPRATSAFTNLITCLICNAVDDDIDPRYHRQPGGGMPEPPSGKDNWFSGRTISENIVYPWLEGSGYRTAKSGWQTRTFERPKPYILDYNENIAHVKDQFLALLDAVAVGKVKSETILCEFFLLEEKIKAEKQALYSVVSKNKIGNELLITQIVEAFTSHFSTSARTPVLAIYSVYQELTKEFNAYDNLELLPMGAHEAADIRTGSIGDIELTDEEDDVVESLEIKHNIQITYPILLKAEEKIRKSMVRRYYILTTHSKCTFTDAKMQDLINRVHDEHGCQIIVNGVIPTIKYYLRLLSNPTNVIENYSKHIVEDRAIKLSHVKNWESILKGF